MSPTKVSPWGIVQGRNLRNNSTGAERKLWQILRQLKIDGVKFRRQVPIGPYIADFASHSVRLIIELDGDQHAYREESRRDAKRTKCLESKGYRVIRFWNVDVFNNIEGVLEMILHILSETPTPTPPLKGEGILNP